MKIHSVGAELLHVDRQMNRQAGRQAETERERERERERDRERHMTKIAVTFHNFANAP
jgi:hypothetical protein